MAIHRQAATTDGKATSVGPVHFFARGVLIANRSTVDAFVLDDSGNRYDCPAKVATTWPLNIPTSRVTVQTVQAAPATDAGALVVTLTDAETILSTAQLSTISIIGRNVIPVYLPGTFPPAAPADGDLAVFLPDPINLPGVRWLFQYNASSTSPFKWESLGASTPMYATVDTYENIPAADGTWKNLATNGPFVTAPRNGDYQCVAGAVASSAGSIRNDMFLGIAAGDVAPSVPLVDVINNQTGYAPEVPLAVELSLLAVAAATQIKARYLVAAGGSAGTQFGRRWISVVPRRIS